MRVLLVTLGAYARLGGMERFNQRMIRALSELKGREIESVRVLSLWDKTEHLTEAYLRNIEFIPCHSNKVLFLTRFLGSILFFRPDVVLLAHIFLSPLAFWLRVFLGRSNTALIVHGFEAWDKKYTPPGYRTVNLLEVYAVKSSVDYVISVSQFTASRMSEAFEINSNRIRLLPNAIDWREFPSNENRQDSLLTVSRLDSYKGVDKVLLALPAVLEKFPEIQYHIVGDGPLKDAWRKLAGELGVQDKVTFWGRVDDDELDSLYAGAKIFIMPSKGEGFGIVFLEAWQHKLPVIAGNQDASAEVVTDGYNGIVIDPDSPEEIANAVITLLSNPALAREMGENGYHTVQEKYTHEKFRQTLATILSEISG